MHEPRQRLISYEQSLLSSLPNLLSNPYESNPNTFLPIDVPSEQMELKSILFLHFLLSISNDFSLKLYFLFSFGKWLEHAFGSLEVCAKQIKSVNAGFWRKRKMDL